MKFLSHTLSIRAKNNGGFLFNFFKKAVTVEFKALIDRGQYYDQVPFTGTFFKSPNERIGQWILTGPQHEIYWENKRIVFRKTTFHGGSNIEAERKAYDAGAIFSLGAYACTCEAILCYQIQKASNEFGDFTKEEQLIIYPEIIGMRVPTLKEVAPVFCGYGKSFLIECIDTHLNMGAILGGWKKEEGYTPIKVQTVIEEQYYAVPKEQAELATIDDIYKWDELARNCINEILIQNLIDAPKETNEQ